MTHTSRDSKTERVRKTSIDPRDDLTLAKSVFKIFCSGLRYSYNEEDIRPLFQQYGRVISVIIPIRKTGGKPGFAIIYMENREDGLDAIHRLNGREVGGFRLAVTEWKPFEERGPKPHDHFDGQSESYGRQLYDNRPRGGYDDRLLRRGYDDRYQNDMSPARGNYY